MFIDQSREAREKRPIPSNTGLVTIDLSSNKLSDEGGFTLAHLLSENKWILGLNYKIIYNCFLILTFYDYESFRFKFKF